MIRARLTTILPLLALLALPGCGGGDSPAGGPGSGNAGSADGNDSAGGGDFKCPIVFDADNVARVQSQGTAASLSFRVVAEGGLIECASTIPASSRHGYSELAVIPKIRASGDPKILSAENQGDPEALEIPVEIQQISDDLKRSLARQLGAQTADSALPATIVARDAEPGLALVGSLPVLKATLEAREIRGRAQNFIRIFFDSRYEADVQAFIPTFKNGTAPVLLLASSSSFTSFPDFLAFSVRRINLFDGERGMSSAELAAEAWARSRNRTAAERLAALEASAEWLRDKPVSHDEAATRLHELLNYARAEWAPAPAPQDIVPDKAKEWLASLSILTAVDPSGPLLAYEQMVERIRPLMGEDDAATLREAIRLVNAHPYDDTQLAGISSAASALVNAGLAVASAPWLAAENLAASASFDADRINLAVSVATWLSQQGLQGTRPFDTARDYVLDRGLTDSLWVLYKTAGEWLSSYDGPSLSVADTLARAENYVFTRHMTRAQYAVIFDSYRWLTDSGGPSLSSSQALARAETYAFARRLTAERLPLLELTYSWLTDYSGPALGSGAALGRAESYVLDRQESPEQLDLLKASYSWLTSYSGPSLDGAHAMGRAESYVFVRLLTSAKLVALEGAYGNLAQAHPSDQALAIAEQQVF